jgi:hypothetical protein
VSVVAHVQILAHKAYMAIWNRRSPHDLVGNMIGVQHGHWLVPGMSGVGAGIDSFFEYGIKAAIMLSTYSRSCSPSDVLILQMTTHT